MPQVMDVSIADPNNTIYLSSLVEVTRYMADYCEQGQYYKVPVNQVNVTIHPSGRNASVSVR
jgi:hypothetical protein